MQNHIESTPSALSITRYTRDQLTRGSFDGGRITETKPIPFPHEGTGPGNTGPLFYWAWATSRGPGKIGLHPHRGFEIISYALAGEIGHFDTLGNNSRVRAGGAQIMQTGSGISHSEETGNEPTDFFQIWFEPDMRQSLQRDPVYQAFEDVDFPVVEQEGVRTKTIVGDASPVVLETEVRMEDVLISKGKTLDTLMAGGKCLACVVVSGSGRLVAPSESREVKCLPGDFLILSSDREEKFSWRPEGNGGLRYVGIEVPSVVSYPLYRLQGG